MKTIEKFINVIISYYDDDDIIQAAVLYSVKRHKKMVIVNQRIGDFKYFISFSMFEVTDYILNEKVVRNNRDNLPKSSTRRTPNIPKGHFQTSPRHCEVVCHAKSNMRVRVKPNVQIATSGYLKYLIEWYNEAATTSDSFNHKI